MRATRARNINSDKKDLSREELLRVLKARFEKNMNRHKGLEWTKVQAKLEANAEKLWSLNEMERAQRIARMRAHGIGLVELDSMASK